jgi:hypothetical protein
VVGISRALETAVDGSWISFRRTDGLSSAIRVDGDPASLASGSDTEGNYYFMTPAVVVRGRGASRTMSWTNRLTSTPR